MKHTMKSKGQAAIEGTFILLFILLSINSIFILAIQQSTAITSTAIARVYAQGTAMELTMKGTTTYLIRIDEVDDGGFKLHVLTAGNCNDVREEFKQKLGDENVALWNCKEKLYVDSVFNS